MSGIQHDLVSNLILDRSSFCPVVNQLHHLLCMSESFFCLVPVSRHLLRKVFGRIALGRLVDTGFEAFPWMCSGGQEERRESGCLVPMIVVHEFSEREFLRPVALIVIPEEM